MLVGPAGTGRLGAARSALRELQVADQPLPADQAKSVTKPVARVGVHQAQAQPSKLLRLVDAGQEVEILRNGEPVARLVAAGSRAVRTFGTDRGRFVVPEDFDALLPPDVLNASTR